MDNNKQTTDLLKALKDVLSVTATLEDLLNEEGIQYGNIEKAVLRRAVVTYTRVRDERETPHGL